MFPNWIKVSKRLTWEDIFNATQWIIPPIYSSTCFLQYIKPPASCTLHWDPSAFNENSAKAFVCCLLQTGDLNTIWCLAATHTLAVFTYYSTWYSGQQNTPITDWNNIGMVLFFHWFWGPGHPGVLTSCHLPYRSFFFCTKRVESEVLRLWNGGRKRISVAYSWNLYVVQSPAVSQREHTRICLPTNST